jgi:hypothetical protein
MPYHLLAHNAAEERLPIPAWVVGQAELRSFSSNRAQVVSGDDRSGDDPRSTMPQDALGSRTR